MFQGPLKQKIRFLAQKMCPLARGQTHKHKNTQTDRHESDYRGHPIGSQDSVPSTYDSGAVVCCKQTHKHTDRHKSDYK